MILKLRARGPAGLLLNGRAAIFPQNTAELNPMVLATLIAISPFVFSILTFPFVVFAASLPCKAQSLEVKTVVFDKNFLTSRHL